MPKSKKNALLKVSLLILFIGVSICLVRFSPARQYFTTDQLGLILEEAGLWAPLLLVFGMGLTKVRFRDYIAGTGLGIMVGTFIFTFFVGTINAIWAGGRQEELLSWNVFLSVALFIFSFFIPKLLKMAKGPGESKIIQSLDTSKIK